MLPDPTRQMPVGLVIRQAEAVDVPAIIALIMAGDILGRGVDTLDPAVRGDYTAAFEAIAASGHETLFVAVRNDAVVGTYQISLSRTLAHRGRIRATIESVHVAPEMRGLGIGEAMMRDALDRARGSGAGLVQLTSNKKRVDAHRFYERIGFQKSHEGFKWEF
jgi:ribosomal protein S18 acetylase RimI-like enzyme